MWSRSMRLGLKKLSCAVDLIESGVIWDRLEGSPAVADFGFGNVRNSLVRHKVSSHAFDKVVVSPLDDDGIVEDLEIDGVVD